MKEYEKIEPDIFFKDKFDTTEIENNIYNQMAKTLARKIDIDLAKTPLVDILTGYTRYKIQEQEIEKAIDYIKNNLIPKGEACFWDDPLIKDWINELLDILED